MATQLVQLVTRMKWLKQNSSDNEQISTAESQPEPEHVLGKIPEEEYAPAPDTHEQLEVESTQKSGLNANVSKTSGRRRNRQQSDKENEVKAKPRTLSKLKHSWLGKHWKTAAILVAIFALGFFARAYYGLEPATEDGFILSGGSDSYYHHYVITEATDTGDHHFWDNMLNYPVGTRNPRPPLYDWSVSLMGIGLSPFFDGDTFTSTFYVFLFSTAFWGALTIFPTYYLGKEAFGRKAGLIAAFLLAIMPGHIQRSVLTNADHDAITLFFIVTTFFFFLKALKIMQQREWITSWGKPKDIFSGLKAFTVTNTHSILYAIMAGISIAAVALIWQGFAYVIVLVSVYYFVQIFINRFRNTDSFSVTAIYFITIGTGLLLAFPYYYQSIQIPSWFDTPAYLFLGLFAFGVILMVTRKFPWFLVLSTIIFIGIVTATLLYLLAPSILDSLVTALLSGGGYFINNKQYQTIAEAQAPSFSNLALSFGVFTFWLSFVGLAWAAVQLPKTWKPDFTLILLWSATSIYMAVTAARFMFNAGPAFAISAGWIISLIISKLNFKSYTENLKRATSANMSNNFKMGLFASAAIIVLLAVILQSMSDFAYPIFVIGIAAVCGIYLLKLISDTNPNRIYNLLTALIPISGALFYIIAEFYTEWELTVSTHVFVLAILLMSYFVLYIQVRRTSFFFTAGIFFLAFCVIAPNVWSGIDAGIPYETKSDYDKQIYNSLPMFMHPEDYDTVNGTTWFLGGFGYSLPLNSNYWPAAYDWLATQDANIYPAYERPAFLSWWDYGFEVVNEGQHPTVADNFLGGHQLAGNFIMAQSEEDAIALLCVRLIEADWVNLEGDDYFTDSVLQLFDQYGIDSTRMQNIFENPSEYVNEILSNPQIYSPRDDEIQDENAKYLAARATITETLDEAEVVNFYHDLSETTGDSIRYFSIDSRLFPFSADNTGIFYAPAKLSDHRIDDSANQPYDFWEIKAIGEYGGEYALDEIPDDVNLNQETPYKIVYKDMFYNSMLYKAFIGYSGSDIGSTEGIPGLSDELTNNPIMPGWNMTHFKLVHRTAYWNPYDAEDIKNHTDEWQAMNYWDAYDNQQEGKGVSDLSDRSSIYQGVMMLKYYDGAIVSGTIALEDGTPLEGISVTVTDDFDIPHQRVTTDSDGLYSIIVPFGNITLTASSGNIEPMTLTGNSLNVTKMFIEDYQAMRVNEDRDNNGKPDYQIKQDLVVPSGSISGYVFWDLNGDSNKGDTEDGVADTIIQVKNSAGTFDSIISADEYGAYNLDIMPPGNYSLTCSLANQSMGEQFITVVSGEETPKNLPLKTTPFTGTVQFSDESPAEEAIVRLWIPEENLYFTSISDVNGTFSFDNVIPGNYSAQAVYYSYASPVQRLEISKTENNTASFTLADSLKLDGILQLNGVPVPYAQILFAGPSSCVVATNDSGYYISILNDGEYTFSASYVKNGLTYTALGRFNVEEDSTMDIPLKLACVVKGKVTDFNGDAASFTQVVFHALDTDIYLSSTTDIQGDYLINVPQANYAIQISSTLSGTYYSLMDLTSQSLTLNMETKKGTNVRGTIYWDFTENGAYDTDEGLDNARITFLDASGNYAQALTNETGNFSITLPATTSYDVIISKIGFQSVRLGSYTPAVLAEIVQAIAPIPLPITGSVYLNDEVLYNQNIQLKFESQYDSSPSETFQLAYDGSYSGYLLPGVYDISFSHNITAGNDTEVYQIDDEFSLDTGLYTGKPLYLDLQAVQRTKISVTCSNDEGVNITFRYGPEDRFFNMPESTDSYYLMPGTYLLSASKGYNTTYKVDMQDININSTSKSFTISLKQGIQMSGILTYNGTPALNQKITFNDTASNGTVSVTTDETGKYTVILIPGLHYDVLVDFVAFEDSENPMAYRYYSSTQTIVAAQSLTYYPVPLNREPYFFTLTGSVTRGESVAANTLLTFISAYDSYSATTNSTGNYSLSLIPAEYTVYAHQPSSHYVALIRTGIEIDQESLNLTLENGNRIYGTAYYDMNKNQAMPIQFTSSTGVPLNITTSAEGYYETWLPTDYYTISSKIAVIKNELNITYSVNQTVTLTADKQLNLPLSMDEQRIVFVSYDPAQLTVIPDNVTVTYSFEVENTGNIRDTYDLYATGGNPDWITVLSQSKITLDPGVNNVAKLSVAVTIPKDAKIDQNQVTITAISQKNNTIQHNTILYVPLIQKYSFNIKPSTVSPKYAGGNISSQFTLSNIGNGADIITLYIANNEDLSNNGWTADLGPLSGATITDGGKILVNISVASGGVSEIPITLTPISDNPSLQASVLIVGYSQNDESSISSAYIILKYPEVQISSGNLTVTGEGVSEAASGDQITNAGVMVVAVASALALFYYARRKRWIR